MCTSVRMKFRKLKQPLKPHSHHDQHLSSPTPSRSTCKEYTIIKNLESDDVGMYRVLHNLFPGG